MNSLPKLPSLSVVFSFRNEEDVLPELIKQVRAVLEGERQRGHLRSYELIFVNDASDDKSLDILLNESKVKGDIRIINMSRCFGVAPCIMAGLEFSRGDLVVYMDADLQDPPEIIPLLLKKHRENSGVEVVHTVRSIRQGESGIKMFVTRMGYRLLNTFSSVNVPVEAGDFKLLSRRAVSYILQCRETRPFVRGLVCWIGFKQDFLEYERHARHGGESKFPVLGWKVFSNFFGSAFLAFSSAPLKIAALCGIIAIGLDFLLLLHVLYEKFFSGHAVPGWTAIMIAVLFMGGVQLFCIGILGIYLDAIQEQGKNRPRYIIESTIGFAPSPSDAGLPSGRQDVLDDNTLIKKSLP